VGFFLAFNFPSIILYTEFYSNSWIIFNPSLLLIHLGSKFDQKNSSPIFLGPGKNGKLKAARLSLYTYTFYPFPKDRGHFVPISGENGNICTL